MLCSPALRVATSKVPEETVTSRLCSAHDSYSLSTQVIWIFSLYAPVDPVDYVPTGRAFFFPILLIGHCDPEISPQTFVDLTSTAVACCAFSGTWYLGSGTTLSRNIITIWIKYECTICHYIY